ncbi:lectin-like domain-containing protein [Listeria kieliensis]
MKRAWMLFLFAFVICMGMPVVSYASGESTPPEGIKLKDVLKVPQGANSSVTEAENQDIAEITANKKNQVGAIWNLDGYKMDLTKNFKMSMYLNFGNKGKRAADGAAFVMQADPNKNDAFRTGDSARLGVWDSLSYKKFGLAIKHSFAVEFDTHYDSKFDSMLVKDRNHIAWGYPDQEETYKDEWSLLGSSRSLIHGDPVFPNGDYLSDGKWHLFTVNWDADLSQLTYKFDNLRDVHVPIDVLKTFGTRQVYWGFTGATGTQFSESRAIFEELPGRIEGETTERVFDTRSKKPVDEGDVYADEMLTYEIDTSYFTGQDDWKNIILKKRLNEFVSHVAGSLRLVGEDGEETSLDESYFEDNQLQVPLGDLKQDGAKKKIRFEVRSHQVPEDHTVTEEATSVGENLTTHSSPVTYTIKSNVAPVVKLRNSGGIVDIENLGVQKPQILGGWTDPDSDWINLYYKIDDGELQKLERQENNPKNVNHNFSIDLNSENLKLGVHQMMVYAVDKEGAKSNVDKLVLVVRGTLKFAELPNFKFELSEIPMDKSTMIRAKFAEKMAILDTRGEGSGWNLKARLKEPLASKEGHQIDQFYYLDETGVAHQLEQDNLIQIRSGKTADSPLQSLEWGEKAGLGIELSPANYSGEYSGTVEWVLEDTPA